MHKRSLFLGLIAVPLIAAAASAQSWDSPDFYSPKPMDDLGLYYFHSQEYFTNFKSGPCSGFAPCSYKPNGLKLVWHQTGNINLGLQAGVGDLKDLGDAILLGAEAGRSLNSMSANGIAAAWSLGAGAVFGSHYVDLAIPFGVSLGLNLGSGTTTFVPYVHPRISLDLASVDNSLGSGSTTTTALGLAADVGVEVGLGQTLLARAAYTFSNDNNAIGKRNTLGVGLALRTPRKVVVRGR